jgi:hypothetical protein
MHRRAVHIHTLSDAPMQSILDTVFLGNAARAWLRGALLFVALVLALGLTGGGVPRRGSAAWCARPRAPDCVWKLQNQRSEPTLDYGAGAAPYP